MRPSPLRDFLAGCFVLAGLAAVAWLSLRVGGVGFAGEDRMRLYAAFDEIGGLTVRAPVVLSGVDVGRVASIGLGPDLRARVGLDVDPGLALPADTTASIRTAGLLGDQYVALEPGGAERRLGPGDEIAFTEDAVILEQVIGRIVHGGGLAEDGL